jgi:arylsulfatase A-like enzyme
VQISEDQLGRAIRTRRWKYSVIAPGIDGCEPNWSDTYVEECLYDLERDPHERTNLVKDPALREVRARLAETLQRRMVAAGEIEPRILCATD